LDLLGSNCPKLLRIEQNTDFEEYPNLLIAIRTNELESFQFVKSYFTGYMYGIEIESLVSLSDNYDDEAIDVEWIFE
jgi:hypothetical protein